MLHWLQSNWDNVFWPSLLGNGPEGLIELIAVGGGGAWLGRKLLREWREHKDLLHDKIDRLHDRLDKAGVEK